VGSQAFVVTKWDHLTVWLLLALLALRRANFLIWTDTPNLMLARRGWRQRARRIFLRWVFGQARYVMGTGQPALRALAAMGAPRSRLVNFPYWIDVNLYRTARAIRASSRSPLVFLSSGRIQNELKGHDIAIRALALLARQDAVGFEYRVAGAGPDADALLRLANAFSIGDRIKLLGWLEPRELIGQMEAADVFIHPSPVHEPYGVAVIEAMAAGLPVLASDVTCAALDRIEQGVNGYIHRAGDVEQLAEHMLRLAQDPVHAATMGESARWTASQWPLSKAATTLKTLLGN
jgi:glycosyltransferase involved in cell wall biosynthesis